jgi:RNA polymerase sigma-70 factor, ECF subfamily
VNHGFLAHAEQQTEMSEPPDDEAELVAAAQHDRSAFAPLYDRYARQVYRYCYRRLGSHEAAEDATRKTFIKALDGLPRYRDGTFRGWLFTIADRVVIDIHRRHQPQTAIDAALEIESFQSDPEASFIAAETSLSVQAMLERLTPDQRRIVALRLAGLTGREIASIVGREHQAVRSLQFRAYARLRMLLRDEETRAT